MESSQTNRRQEEAEIRILRLLERTGGMPEALKSQGLSAGAPIDDQARAKICQGLARDFMADPQAASRRYGINSLEGMREISESLASRGKAMRAQLQADRQRSAEAPSSERGSFLPPASIADRVALRRGSAFAPIAAAPERSEPKARDQEAMKAPAVSAVAPSAQQAASDAIPSFSAAYRLASRRAFAASAASQGAEPPEKSGPKDKTQEAIEALARAPGGPKGSLLDRLVEDVKADRGLKDYFAEAKVSYRGTDTSAGQARDDLARRGLLRETAGDFNQQAGVTQTAESVSREARERMEQTQRKEISGLIGIPQATASRNHGLERDLFDYSQQVFDHKSGLRSEPPEMPKALQEAVIRQAAKDPSIAPSAGTDASKGADLGLGMSREHMEIRKAVAQAHRELPPAGIAAPKAQESEARQAEGRDRLGFGQDRQEAPERKKNPHSLGPEARAKHMETMRGLRNAYETGKTEDKNQDKSRGR